MIGAGWVTQYHLPAWRKLAGRAQIVAIADPAQEARERRAAEFGIGTAYASAEALLESEQLDAVDICSPRETHEAMVALAAAHGLPILCQKPLAPTLAAAEALVHSLPTGTRLMVHDNWRFRPLYRELKAWLAAGTAGRVRSVRLSFLSSGMIADADGRRPALVRQPFLKDLPRLLVSEILIHHLDTLRYLFGELEVESAVLERGNMDILAEDVATVSLCSLDGRLPVQVMANLAVQGAPPAPADQLTIFGTDGTIRVDGPLLTLAGPHAQTVTFDGETNYQGGYDGAIRHFVDGLETGAGFETDATDNLETLALVEAIYEQAGEAS